MYLRRVGVVPILSRMENIELWCVGDLRFLFWPSFATVRCSDIYRDIPTWVPWCLCYIAVIVEGCNCYGRDG